MDSLDKIAVLDNGVEARPRCREEIMTILEGLNSGPVAPAEGNYAARQGKRSYGTE